MTTYAIRVAGHLDDRRAATWLGEVAVTREDDGTTTVTVSVADQAQLHGVLAGLRDIGAVLIELRAATAPTPPGAPLLERTLHTRRLALRAATADDAEATWRYRRLDTVGEWLTSSGAEHDAYCTTFVEPDRLAATVIVTLGHDAAAPIIGDFMLRRQDAWAQSEVAERARDVQGELGWVLDPAYTGNGYATEAVRELLRHCFEDLGVHRVTAGCFLENDASWRLMERVGMRREQHAVRDALHRSGRWLDSLGYAMLADEWPPERSGAASMPERADVHIEESAMESERSAPQTTGVTQELLATVDLGAEIEGMAGRQLRMRMVTIEPGGVFGPVHDHVDRPGLVYVLQGTITDHRDGVATDYGPGVGWPEDRHTVHWLENRGTAPAVEISVDIVRSE